jgi:acetolactate synthase-1/3 small subunit
LEAGSCCIHAKAALAAAAFDESIACQARRLPAPGEGSEKRNLSFMKHIIAVLLENEPGALSRDVIEQITKHLTRLIEVVKVVDLTEGSYTERELMMVKVRAVGKEREEMKRMADIFRGRIIDVTEKSYTVELTGDQSKNDAFLQALDRTAILETVRTGSCGIGRGERILRV